MAERPVATRWLRRCADGCQLLLSVLLWTSGNLLAALGLLLLLVILAADARPLLFFAHLDNLASHYLAADEAARAAFDRQLIGFSGALWALLMLARLPAFVARLGREAGEGSHHG